MLLKRPGSRTYKRLAVPPAAPYPFRGTCAASTKGTRMTVADPLTVGPRKRNNRPGQESLSVRAWLGEPEVPLGQSAIGSNDVRHEGALFGFGLSQPADPLV